jgi:WD40 repeat protein/tetratricopeptide (TPR) repeat protein
VGRFERTWRWCRRNRALAALTTGIAVTLVAGAAASTYFALQARARAADAITERNRADAKASESRINARRADAKAIESQANADRAEQETLRANAKTDEARRNLYAAHLGLSMQAWKSGNFAVARELLEKHAPQSAADDLRTFEWFLLWRLCHWRNVRIFQDHEQGVAAVAYAPDGRLASAGADRAVRIRDPRSGHVERTLWERSAVSALAFSPDGSLLATAVAGARVRLWRVETGEVVREVAAPAGGVIRHVAFSPDGRFVAACTGDIVGRTPAAAVVWDTASGEQQLELKPQTSVFGVVFAPEGRLFVTAGGSYFAQSELKIWDFPAGTGRATLDGHSGVVYDARFTRDGKSLVTSGSDTTIRIWDVEAGRQIGRLDGHAHEVQGIDLSDDGTLVASASSDATARVWDIHSHMPVRTLGGHLANVTHVAFAPDSSELATSSADGTIRVWDLTRPPGDQVLSGHEQEIRRVRFSPDGSRVATADFGGVIRFWDAGTGELQKTLAAGAGFDDFAFTPDGSGIAAWAERAVSIWTLADDSRRILRDEIDVASLGFSPGGELLAVSTAFWQSRDPGVILLLDTSTGRELREIPAPHVEAFTFTSDGARLVTASRNGDVKIWDLATGAEQRSMRFAPNLRCVALSHDDRLIATGGTDGLVVVFDAKSGERVFALAGHRSYVYGVTFIDDSRTLATSSWDGTVRFWDMVSGQERMTLPAHRAGLWSLAFSPDGRTMVTASRDHTARLWTAASESEVEQDRSATLLDAAYYQLVQMRWDAAAAGYARVIERNPRSGEAWYGRGRARAMLKEWDAAEADLSKAIELRPDYAPSWVERSAVRLALGRPEESLTDASRAIELGASSPQLRSRKGSLLARSGRWPEAAAEYERAVSQQPDNRSLLQPLAIAQLASGDLEGYKRTCRQGIERFTGSTDRGAANDVAWLCALGPDALPDFAGAVALARTAVAAPSGEATNRQSLLNTLGAVLYRAGQHQEAISTLNEALDAHGSGGTAWDWVFLAMAHHRLGEADEARRWLHKVSEAIQGNATGPLRSDAWVPETELKVLHEEARALMPRE